MRGEGGCLRLVAPIEFRIQINQEFKMSQPEPEILPPKKKLGGARPGAGRPKGKKGPTKRTVDFRRRFEAGSGPDPFDVVSRRMMYWAQRAELLRKRLRERIEEIARENGQAADPQAEFLQSMDSPAVKEIQHAYEQATTAAEMIMPYLRARLSAIKVQSGVRITGADLDEATDVEFLAIERIVERAERRQIAYNGGTAASEGAAGIPENNGQDAGAKS